MTDEKKTPKAIPFGEAALAALGIDLEALKNAPTPKWVEEAVDGLEAMGRAMVVARNRLKAYVEELDTRHDRGAVRQALLRRRQWKKGDLPHLRSLPGLRLSERRRQQVANRKFGRPVLQPFKPLSVKLGSFAQNMAAIFDAKTPPHQRLKLFKQTPWWPWFVECFFRGCYSEAKANGTKGPFHAAEEEAARALSISADSLRKICGAIRKRNDADGVVPDREITRAEFDRWHQTGDFPEV